MILLDDSVCVPIRQRPAGNPATPAPVADKRESGLGVELEQILLNTSYELTAAEKAVWAVLLCKSWGYGTAEASNAYIVARAGISERAIPRVLKKLEAIGRVKRELRGCPKFGDRPALNSKYKALGVPESMRS